MLLSKFVPENAHIRACSDQPLPSRLPAGKWDVVEIRGSIMDQSIF